MFWVLGNTLMALTLDFAKRIQHLTTLKHWIWVLTWWRSPPVGFSVNPYFPWASWSQGHAMHVLWTLYLHSHTPTWDYPQPVLWNYGSPQERIILYHSIYMSSNTFCPCGYRNLLNGVSNVFWSLNSSSRGHCSTCSRGQCTFNKCPVVSSGLGWWWGTVPGLFEKLRIGWMATVPLFFYYALLFNNVHPAILGLGGGYTGNHSTMHCNLFYFINKISSI